MSKIEKALAPQTGISLSDVSNRIYTLRGCQVMLDSDLAEIYQVETKNLKRAVKRNMERFPSDFLFEPSADELELLRFQFVTEKFDSATPDQASVSCDISESNSLSETHEKVFRCKSGTEDSLMFRRGRYTPFVFTEPGVAMLSSVLHSERSIQVNISIMRVFIQLRARMLMNQIDLSPKLDCLQSGLAQIQQRLNQFGTKVDISAAPASARQEPNKAKLIQEAVARFWGLRSEDLNSQARTQPISLARQVAVFFMRKHLGMGFSEIGRHLGGRDHSTILHAYRKIHVDSEDNETVKKSIMTLLNEIQPLLT